MGDNDCLFLAAAKAALSIVERYGIRPGDSKAMTVGMLTFYLLELLKEHRKEG